LVRDGLAIFVGSPAAVFFFFTRVPFSGIATRGFALVEAVGAVEAGANGFGFFFESVFIWFPLA
jgi:hypothetical protein